MDKDRRVYVKLWRQEKAFDTLIGTLKTEQTEFGSVSQCLGQQHHYLIRTLRNAGIRNRVSLRRTRSQVPLPNMWWEDSPVFRAFNQLGSHRRRVAGNAALWLSAVQVAALPTLVLFGRKSILHFIPCISFPCHVGVLSIDRRTSETDVCMYVCVCADSMSEHSGDANVKWEREVGHVTEHQHA